MKGQSAQDAAKMTYKTVSNDQGEILHTINALYLNGQGVDLDPMYGKGAFYKNFPEPRVMSDIADEFGVDATEIPLDSGLTHSMILDPPFMHAQGRESALGRYGTYASQKALQDLYHRLLWEAARVLKDKGVLIFKCQDTVESGKQVMNHVLIHEMATRIGFETLDLFVLLAKSRVVGHNHQRQVHARKYHSFFWVFQKNERKYRRAGMWRPKNVMLDSDDHVWIQLPLEESGA